jgi:hypothetical protein
MVRDRGSKGMDGCPLTDMSGTGSSHIVCKCFEDPYREWFDLWGSFHGQ